MLQLLSVWDLCWQWVELYCGLFTAISPGDELELTPKSMELMFTPSYKRHTVMQGNHGDVCVCVCVCACACACVCVWCV